MMGKERKADVLQRSYEAAEDIMKQRAKSFYEAFMRLSEDSLKRDFKGFAPFTPSIAMQTTWQMGMLQRKQEKKGYWPWKSWKET